MFVSRLECGVRQPTLASLIGIGLALGVLADEMVWETEQQYLAHTKMAQPDLQWRYFRAIADSASGPEPASAAATSGKPATTTANATAAKPEPTDKQLEKLTTTAKRPVYCSDAAPTGSLIRRGVVCDPPPRTSAERTAQKLMNKQTVDDSVELSDKLMRERMDCEAMRGHENGGTKIPGCI